MLVITLPSSFPLFFYSLIPHFLAGSAQLPRHREFDGVGVLRVRRGGGVGLLGGLHHQTGLPSPRTGLTNNKYVWKIKVKYFYR